MSESDQFSTDQKVGSSNLPRRANKIEGLQLNGCKPFLLDMLLGANIGAKFLLIETF